MYRISSVSYLVPCLFIINRSQRLHLTYILFGIDPVDELVQIPRSGLLSNFPGFQEQVSATGFQQQVSTNRFQQQVSATLLTYILFGIDPVDELVQIPRSGLVSNFPGFQEQVSAKRLY